MTENEFPIYTDKLEEAIYYATEKDTEEKATSELQKFFKELIERKRNDSLEGGLQAAMLIFPNIFLAKVNEEDGMGSHAHSNINLVKFMNGDHKYLTKYGIRKFNLYAKERNQIYDKATEIRILDGEEEMMLAIISNKDLESVFELKMIKRIILICNNLMKKNYYKNIDIGIHTPRITIDFGEWTDKKEKMMLEEIENNIRK